MSANAQLREMEISTALLTEGDQECIGFTIHPMAARTAAAGSSLEQLCSAIGQLTTRIGSAQLQELLHEVALLAQQHFVRSAGTGGERCRRSHHPARRQTRTIAWRSHGGSCAKYRSNRLPACSQLVSGSLAFGQADLSNCERELIHLAGSVQAHGILLALAETCYRIVQASANTQSHLARGVQSLLGLPVAVLGADRESHLLRLTQLSDLAQPVPPWMSPTPEPGLRWRLCWRKSTYPRNALQGCTRISAAWARRERLTARPCHRPVPVARTGRDAIRRPVAPRSR